MGVKAIVDIDPQIRPRLAFIFSWYLFGTLGQIAYMADTRLYTESLAEVLTNRFCLCGRFYDHQGLAIRLSVRCHLLLSHIPIPSFPLNRGGMIISSGSSLDIR